MDEPLARTVSAQIRIRIREKILSGAYPPGSQLLQDSIAAEFGSSKIPVREALLQLRSEGLVDIFAPRGFQGGAARTQCGPGRWRTRQRRGSQLQLPSGAGRAAPQPRDQRDALPP